MDADIEMENFVELKKRRPISENLVDKLFRRESGWKAETDSEASSNNCRQLSMHFPFENNFYKSIVPNFTIQNITKPNNYLRKFTPDGKFLLGITNDQRSIVVWRYSGIGALANRLESFQQECILESQIPGIETFGVFNSFLKKEYTLRLVNESSTRCHINREFSIFFNLPKATYVLMVSLSLSLNGNGGEVYFRYPDVCDDFDLFHYTFHLINLTSGDILDSRRIMNDYIVLTHNHGVSAANRTIAILSMHKQVITLLEVNHRRLVPVYEIGPFANLLDEIRITSIPIKFDSEIREPAYSHLKQRIMAYLYLEINDIRDLDLRRKKLKDFYKKIRTFERMYMTKMQLVTSEYMLIRYEDRLPALPMTRTMEGSADPDFKLYVFYSLKTSDVVRIYNHDSVDLLNLLKNHCDTFRNCQSFHTKRPTSSPNNNIYYKAAFESAIASSNSEKEAALRFNPTFPISSQSFSTSPYLDYSLFNYDDRLVSALERPKFVTAEPVVFTNRLTNKVSFRLHLDHQVINNTWLPQSLSFINPNNDEAENNENTLTSNTNSTSAQQPPSNTQPQSQAQPQQSLLTMVSSNREVVFFIFHPYEPFIISMQKHGVRHIINFHLYNPSTIVSQ